MNILEKSEKKRLILSAFFNLAVVALGLVADSMDIAKGGETPLRFYTEDSNLLAQLACIIMAAYVIRRLVKGAEVPRWACILKYMAACCLTVTFLAVIFVLSPQFGPRGYYLMLLTDTMLYMHLLCPVLCVASFLLLDPMPEITKRDALLALAPTVIYAVVSAVLNILRVMVGPYPFLHVYEQPVWASVLWFIAIPGGAYLIALLLRFGRRRCAKKLAGAK